MVKFNKNVSDLRGYGKQRAPVQASACAAATALISGAERAHSARSAPLIKAVLTTEGANRQEPKARTAWFSNYQIYLEGITISMDLSPAFFDLQLRFADAVARIHHLSFEETLLNYTNLYMQFVGRSFNSLHPVWQTYLSGLRQAPERSTWTYSFYQHTKEPHVPYPYGCFQYSYLPEENTIRYHFVNADTSGSGPLSKERMPLRLQELKMMFAEIKKQYGDTPLVRGNSWLYNIDAYKRLFPNQYTQTMEVVDDEFQYMSFWGQFLQHNGQVRGSLIDSVLPYWQQQETFDGLVNCFPYQVLSPQCPIPVFYEFYEV